MMMFPRRSWSVIFACAALFMATSQAQGLPLVQPEKAVAPEIRSFAGNHLHAMTGDVDLPLSKNAQSIATQKSMPTPHAPPPFKSLRYDEDYRYLHEPQRQSDFWDSIKYIPIKDRENWFLSIGGEMRQRYEFYHNPNFGTGPSDSRGNNDYLLQRYFLHADLHLGQHLRFFGQFMSSLEDGRIGGPRPEVDRNVFDVHQGFMDLVILFKDMMPFTLRLGRQEFEYGSGRLISAREVPNTRRSFDAARLLFRVNKWAIDGFWGKPVRNRFSVFDDDPDPNKSLWGVYAVRSHSFLPDGHADLYYLGFENKQGVFAQGTAHEVRHTLGTRLWGNPCHGSITLSLFGSSAGSGPEVLRPGQWRPICTIT